MEFSEEIRNHIKNNVLHIITKMKRKPRNYLNKQLQDAICNYFLENYVAVFLKDDYQVVSGRELRQKIERILPSEGKKYINLLNKFKSEILRVNKGDEYRFMLSSIVDEEDNFPFESKEWITLSKKKMIALLLLVHWDQENILNFYDMWNALFPNDPLVKQKMSKEEKEKQKYLARARIISDQVTLNSSIKLNEKKMFSITSQAMTNSTNSLSFQSAINESQINYFNCFNNQNDNSIGENHIYLEFLPIQKEECYIPIKKINNNIIDYEDDDNLIEQSQQFIRKDEQQYNNQPCYFQSPQPAKYLFQENQYHYYGNGENYNNYFSNLRNQEMISSNNNQEEDNLDGFSNQFNNVDCVYENLL